MMIDRANTYEDHSHPRRYNSFLLRCWHVRDGELRIKLEHIQSGNAAQVETYEAATAWLSEHCAASHEPEEPP